MLRGSRSRWLCHWMARARKNGDPSDRSGARAETAADGQFHQLVIQVERLLTVRRPVVVAVSGFGGSGKSTLADNLGAHFGLSGAQILRGDSLYSTNPHGRGLFDMTDWPRLTRLLATVRGADRLAYVGREYGGRPVVVDEAMPDVLIVEGIRLLRPDFMHLYDLAIWIDCPHDIATARAKVRNRSQGEPDQEIALWDSLWVPLDAQYFREYSPLSLATFVFKAQL